MKENRKSYTIQYTLLNMAYFAAFCTLHAYAAVFLLDHGFSNTEVGVLLAVANITSALAQPFVAGLIDKPGPLTNRNFILISVLLILAGSVLLMFARSSIVLIFIVYTVIYMVQFTYQPVMTALCFEYRKAGYDIMYGLSRGLGSAGFAITSAFVGGMVEKNGVFVLLVVNVITMIVSAAIILMFKKIEYKADDIQMENKEKSERSGEKEQKAHNNIKEFAHIYPAFALFLIGTVCFFFAHNMINDFMIQIIRDLGGAERELGYSNFLQAILELPVMALIGVVLKKISARNLLLISGVAFLVKIFILIFARSMTAMYVSQSFQLFAYAVFIPAAAYYVNETMEELDQVKGQAFITTAITVGGVFSNLISGRLLDAMGVKSMLVTGTVVCAIGVAVAFWALCRLPSYMGESTHMGDNTVGEKAGNI
ncbi:MAG: MFS transporter [Lachnospiraceae bacterium]|nr:MFS transporter [Lachnospiraceae bacterium]